MHPNLTVSSPSTRVWTEEADRSAIFAMLDRAADLCVDPVPTLLVRSSFRLDHGDPVGAWQDVRRVAASIGTPYATALAARYRGLPQGSSSAMDVELTGLPEPTSALDEYLRGYHLMRIGQYAEGALVLEDERLAEHVPSQELAITALTLPFARLSREERKSQAHAMYERAVRLEEAVGRRTATTAYLIGTALLHQERYASAVRILRDGVLLCPRSHGLRINASRAAWRVGLLEEAREHAETAIALRPDYRMPYDTLVRIHVSEGRFDEALDIVDTTPFGSSSSGQQARLVTRAQVETERALQRWVAGDESRALESAREAISGFDQARQLAELAGSSEETICRALVDGEPGRVFVGVARLLESDPLRWRRLDTLLQWMPTDLGDEEAEAMKTYLLALRDELAQQETVTEDDASE